MNIKKLLILATTIFCAATMYADEKVMQEHAEIQEIVTTVINYEYNTAPIIDEEEGYRIDKCPALRYKEVNYSLYDFDDTTYETLTHITIAQYGTFRDYLIYIELDKINNKARIIKEGLYTSESFVQGTLFTLGFAVCCLGGYLHAKAMYPDRPQN